MVRIEAVLTATAVLLHLAHAGFRINYDANTFEMDGKPFRYVSGSLHYFRIPKEYWRDRLRKIRAAGLNAISTYVEWSQHEAIPGVYDFSSDLDLPYFIRLAEEEGLYVILRPGPYICAERDFGGLPYWLLHKHPGINLRTKDRNYQYYVEKWLDALMVKMKPLLYGNGGPIILVQVENEYGSYKVCDKEHLIWLRDLFKRHVEDNAVLFTTDGAWSALLQCGTIPGVYATVDFGAGSDVKKLFGEQRKFEPKGPLVNSEFYPGWLTHWGEKMARKDTEAIIKTLKEMLDMGANVNFYMFHGGTNFGFTAGANYDNHYESDITSYDYDAPISESGDLTPKYYAIRDVVRKYLQDHSNITVSTAEKEDYGEIELTAVANILSPKVKDLLGNLKRGLYPVTFEVLNQNFGYLLYETIITINASNIYLKVPVVKDIANIYLKDVYIDTLSREFQSYKVYLPKVNRGDKLSILVENLGRINFGPLLKDTKGIITNVYLADEPVTSWNMTSFELADIKPLEYCVFANNMGESCLNGGGHTFYAGSFKLPISEKNESAIYPLDSFLNVSNLTKGLVFINNKNLGRYWSVRGPQFTLYVPGVYLKSAPEENTIVVMDEFISSPRITVKFSKQPIFDYD